MALAAQRATPHKIADTVSMTRHVDPKSVLDVSGRPDNSPLLAGEWPLTCTDGSLVIDADGRVSTATPEQRQIALAAKSAKVRTRAASAATPGEFNG